ncbi:hypothetical protein MYXO_00214 [Myxococcaceae bacterium]|nr:hypothetical protein MYXO_00214 [Myxococcaceae bacterium]
MRRSLFAAACVLLLAGPALASGGMTPEQAEAARAGRGRACTPTGCGPAPGSTAGSVAGFGVAALGAAWVAKRRRRPAQRI